MRLEEIINQCSQEGEEIIWARKGSRELVSYRKNVVYIAEKGIVGELRSQGKAKLTSSDKLKHFFDVIARIEKGVDREEAFVSTRRILDSGTEAICLETMGGDQKWIDRKLLVGFAYKRRYWFDGSGWNNGMVFVEEDGRLAGIIMVLNVKG